MKARIVELAGKGLTDEQIAVRLGCTPRHVAKVRQEMGLLRTRESLVCRTKVPQPRGYHGRYVS